MNIFKKKMTLIADVVAKLRTPKSMVKQISKNSRCRGPLDKQHPKAYQPLFKCERHHIYHIYWSLWRQLSWRKSLLVICKVLSNFVNIWTADDKYSLINRDNLNGQFRCNYRGNKKHLLNLLLYFWNLH